MTPMFVETQSSQGPESLAASQFGAMKGKLRATQTSLEFSQTQTEGTTFIQHPGFIIHMCTGMINLEFLFSQVVVQHITG